MDIKVHVTTVGVRNHQKKVTWPDGWPVPREGDSIEIPDLPEIACVRTVVWYPEGEEGSEPFVYLVLGSTR